MSPANAASRRPSSYTYAVQMMYSAEKVIDCCAGMCSPVDCSTTPNVQGQMYTQLGISNQKQDAMLQNETSDLP